MWVAIVVEFLNCGGAGLTSWIAPVAAMVLWRAFFLLRFI